MIRRAARFYTIAAVTLLSTCVFVVLLEVGAMAVLYALPPEPTELDGERSPYFVGRPWTRRYWREFKRATKHPRYQPFAMWRLAPFEGRLIRIDREGLRVTPGARCDAGARRVYIFGGSTVWGYGSPDHRTIPAHLQRTLFGDGDGCVVNFGQPGYTSTQGLASLENELRNDRRPDVVIFYDGVNDSVATFAYGRPGLHLFLPQIAQKMEASAFTSLVHSTNLQRLARRIANRGAGSPDRPEETVNVTISGYLATVGIVKALAREYGFHALFFWQPTNLTDAEAKWIAPFMRRVHQRFRDRAARIDGVHDLTGLFGPDTATAYIDWHHTTPEGNETIARAIREAIRGAAGGWASN